MSVSADDNMYLLDSIMCAAEQGNLALLYFMYFIHYFLWLNVLSAFNFHSLYRAMFSGKQDSQIFSYSKLGHALVHISLQ